MDLDFDHITQMITALALAYIAWQNHTGNRQGKQNGVEIAKTQEETIKVAAAVNGALAASKAEAQTASERLLNTSTTAAHAEGVLEEKQRKAYP